MAEPEPVTVWMVHLEREAIRHDVKGTLSLEGEVLAFEASSTGVPSVFPLSAITAAKRVRSSAVFMIEWRESDVRHRTAFYFTQPPPLPPGVGGSDPNAGRSATPDRMNPFKAFTSGKRRSMRVNTRYLQDVGISKKELIKLWADEVNARISPSG